MRSPEFSDDQLLAGLRAAAAELGEPLTNNAYDTWQRAHDDAASPALLIRRFATWRAACQAAGLRTNTTRSTTRRWSDEDVVTIVARYLADPGSTGTFADYSAWAAEQEDAPSGATLRQRAPWAEIKRQAERLNGD